VPAALVVPPAMAIVMTAVPFMTFALVVSSILAPPIRAFAPSAPTHSPVTSVRPDGSQKQQDQQSFHLKPYLSVRGIVPALAVVQTVVDLASLLHVGCQQADGLCARELGNEGQHMNTTRTRTSSTRTF
jgi:hypothetical protein